MGKKVFLSAGHGGSDPGAVGNGLKEKDINLQIMLADKAELERHGVEVICSRLKDENDPVTEEVKEANASGAKIAVSHHVNSAENNKADGSESLYYGTSAEGKLLAEYCEEETKKLGQNSRGVVARNDLWFLRGTKMVAVITESAFINNKNDISILDTVTEQQKFGQAYAKAILRHLGIEYKPVTTSVSTTGKAEEVKVDYAKSFNKAYAGTYTVKSSDGLNMRTGANTSKKLIKNIPNGEKVQCYGYYTRESDGTVWLLVTYKGYTGFMSKGYLK
ncbi:MAG: N-acetylmuramoyl-L-alanine amidase [Tyzzerella sp.]|nr:N-acetylmuramoyl-L-alanine amidase [Tyzzerella sp.]